MSAGRLKFSVPNAGEGTGEEFRSGNTSSTPNLWRA